MSFCELDEIAREGARRILIEALKAEVDDYLELIDVLDRGESEDVVRGSCLCGGIQYEYNGEIIRFSLDHCSRCQKSTGSAFGAWIVAQPPGFRWIAGEELVRRYVAPVRETPGETPPGYIRTFCSVCGGPAPYVDESIVGLPAGTLDDKPALTPEMHVFVDRRAAWFEIKDALPQFGSGPPQPN